MDFKKSNAPLTTVTRNLNDLSETTGNIYESIAIIGKRANQISAAMKDEITKKLQIVTFSTEICNKLTYSGRKYKCYFII